MSTETAIAVATLQFRATQTSEAQAVQATSAMETAQVGATQTAFPLTATPWAAIVAEVLRSQQQADRRANWKAFVLNPLLLALLTLVVLVLLGLAVGTYRRLVPALEMRLRAATRRYRDGSRLLQVDGRIVECEPVDNLRAQPELHQRTPSQLPNVGSVHVEIVPSSDPPIDRWIAEAEQQLRMDWNREP